jgi:bla regulator protein blaR1
MMLRQPVIDRTGLAGGYDFELKFSPEGLPGIPTGPPGSPGPPIDANSPTLFAALEEQLGLRLASLRAPAKVVVVDSVSAPTPD